MVSIKMLIAVAIIVIVGFGIIWINTPLPPKNGEKKLFPDIVGDMMLRNNETGIFFIRNITLYDDFDGDIKQGYRATYVGGNGTMVIFLAQMQDNVSTIRALKNMVTRAGYNEGIYNKSIPAKLNNSITVTRLPSDNPEAFAMQKDVNTALHYVFSKKDKVYWIAFNSSEEDIPYQLGMLIEVYQDVDKVKGDFGTFDI